MFLELTDYFFTLKSTQMKSLIKSSISSNKTFMNDKNNEDDKNYTYCAINLTVLNY